MPSVAHIIRRRHNRKRRRQQQGRRSAIWIFVIICIPSMLASAPLLAALGLSVWLYGTAASIMPATEDTIFPAAVTGVTQFFDRSGQRLLHSAEDPLGDNRRWLKIEDLPAGVIDATLLAEESAFPSEGMSFDFLSTLMQLWRYIFDLPLESDRSIAGELVRDTMLPLTHASGLDRDLLEIVLTAESKRTLSPQDLLEWRVNSRYYGHGAYGIDAAAQIYLDKSAESLSLLEAAILAAVGAEPALNPLDAEARAGERGADLLFNMLDAGMIDKAEFDRASSDVIVVGEPAADDAAFAQEFLKYARSQAESILERLGLDGARLIARGGLKITTSLDLELQLQSECLLRTHLRNLRGEGGQVSALDGSSCEAARGLPRPVREIISAPDRGALTLIDANSGQILSMVGEAAAYRHQAGIVLQPFVYMNAFLRRDYTPASMVYDIPQSYPGPSAELIFAAANADGRHRGPMNLRDAMAAGLLPPAVQVASTGGMASILKTASAMGFSGLDASRYDLDVLERGGEFSVLDSAYVYSVLASMGSMRGVPTVPLAADFRGHDPVAITKIEDGAGNVLWSYDQVERDLREIAVIEPSLAYMVNDILADATARQTALEQSDLELRLSRTAAVLDGLSADQRDNWTVGYTPDLSLALHMERGDGGAISFNSYERAGTAPVWRSLMEYAHQQLALPERDWRVPADIEEYLVCEISGLLPATTDHCPTRREIVPAGSRLRRDDFWQTVEINRSTGHLSTVNTPANLRERTAYFVPPDEILEWWLENEKPLPPNSYSTDARDISAKPVQITTPADYAYVGARVDIVGRINRPGAESWLLEYGADVNPERWITIGERRTSDGSGEITTDWETALFSGIYSLRLTVTFGEGRTETDSKLLTFDNTPPAVKLRTSDADPGVQFAVGQAVSLVAEVSDNLTIERVEIYREDELVGVDRNWPYGLEYRLDTAGEIVLRALAFDQVGNRAESDLVITVARE